MVVGVAALAAGLVGGVHGGGELGHVAGAQDDPVPRAKKTEMEKKRTIPWTKWTVGVNLGIPFLAIFAHPHPVFCPSRAGRGWTFV